MGRIPADHRVCGDDAGNDFVDLREVRRNRPGLGIKSLSDLTEISLLRRTVFAQCVDQLCDDGAGISNELDICRHIGVHLSGIDVDAHTHGWRVDDAAPQLCLTNF